MENAFTFDKIKSAPRIGDRSSKENDKNLFLETLLSAGEKLYISYIGRNAEDNAVLPPSSVTDTLISYISRAPNAPSDLQDSFILQQPLHSYSRQFNQPGGLFRNYLITEKSATDFLKSNNPENDTQSNEVLLRNIISFYEKSCSK